MIGRYQFSNTYESQTILIQNLVLIKEFLSLVMNNFFNHFRDQRERRNRPIFFWGGGWFSLSS